MPSAKHTVTCNSNSRVRLGDPAIRESLVASSVLCLALLGVPYLLAWLKVAGTALAARVEPVHGPILVCGHRLRAGAVSGPYRKRLDQAARLAREIPDQPVLLLGGGAPSEAAAGRDYLVAAHGFDTRRLLLEQASTDSLENLRNARELIRTRALCGDEPVLISSRYHLARLAVFSRQLGMRCRLCPAEHRHQLGLVDLRASLFEAGYLCWFVLGRLYARLAGRHALLARIR